MKFLVTFGIKSHKTIEVTAKGHEEAEKKAIDTINKKKEIRIKDEDVIDWEIVGVDQW